MQLNYLNIIKNLIQETSLKKSVYNKCLVLLRPKCSVTVKKLSFEQEETNRVNPQIRQRQKNKKAYYYRCNFEAAKLKHQ